MPDFTTNNAKIIDAALINIIIGRNGAGKSRFLRTINNDVKDDERYRAIYVSPERGGIFVHDANLEQSLINENWSYNVRNANQAEGFRKISAIYLKELELFWLRSVESKLALRTDLQRTFETEYLDKINDLLINIRILRDPTKGSFSFETYDGTVVSPSDLSSGESEAVTLATEILRFFSMLNLQRKNILMLDEPDVHLHPDLQARLGRFIIGLTDGLSPEERNATLVVIATHSTALTASLSAYIQTKIAVKVFDNNNVIAKDIDAQIRKTAAFFAHPLSQVIAQDPILIIEGEDDSRVLQQAARSSQGRIKIFPCVAESVTHMATLETFCNEILGAMYDHPIGYSIRDGDGQRGTLTDAGCIKRFRLQCYAIENLLLSDEGLAKMNSNWQDFQTRAQQWCINRNNPTDNQIILLQQIINSPDRCRDVKIKDVRTLICAILHVNKPWEVLLGQCIAALPNPLPAQIGATSLIEFFGVPALKALGFSTTT